MKNVSQRDTMIATMYDDKTFVPLFLVQSIVIGPFRAPFNGTAKRVEEEIQEDQVEEEEEQFVSLPGCNQGLRTVYFLTMQGGQSVPVNSSVTNFNFATCGIATPPPPQWIAYFDCVTHLIYNDTTLIINPADFPNYIRYELICDGFYDCQDYSGIPFLFI